MKLENPYVVLQHPDRSPAIFRIDKISRIDEMPGGRTRITYGDRTVLVRGHEKDVRKAIREAEYDFIKRRRVQGIESEREEYGAEGDGEVSGRESCDGDDTPLQ